MFPDIDLKHLTSLVIRELKNLKGDQRLDITNIKNGENLAIAAARPKIDMNDMRWHGSGGNGGTPADPTTYFQINNNGVFGTADVFWDGQNVNLNQGYIITPSGVTTVDLSLVGGSSNAGDNVGAIVRLVAGNGHGDGNGGGIQESAGNAGTGVGTGGSYTASGGVGGDAGGLGGDIGFNAGPGGVAGGDGGSIFFTAGDTQGGDSSGGSLFFKGGLKSGLGGYGSYFFNNDTHSSLGELDFSLLTGDRVYTFPDQSGTIALVGSSIDNEIVSGSGTSFTLASTPALGTEHIYGNGQRLTPGGVDYTISGASITTVNSFSAGTILADYKI